MINKRSQPTHLDPAVDAGNLLIRLGMAVLAIGVPCGAIGSRRLIFILMPVGAVLIVLGAMMTPGEGSLRRIAEAMPTPVSLAMIFLIGWAGLSLVWTPFFGPASERFLKIGGTILLTALASACLSPHTKVSNLNLFPIGAGLAAIAIFIVALTQPPEMVDLDASKLERATIGLIIIVWPALGALAIRQRWAATGGLAVAVAFAVIAVWTPLALVAMTFATAAFAAALYEPKRAALWLGWIFAALFALAPIFPLIISLLGPSYDPDSLFAPLHVWSQIIQADGIRLFTGHGLDTATRGVISGMLPANTPHSILFEIWYELGIIGALVTAWLVRAAFNAAERFTHPGAATFVIAGLTCDLSIAISGLSTAQLWFVTTLAMTAIAFTAVGKGQYRVTRPRLPNR